MREHSTLDVVNAMGDIMRAECPSFAAPVRVEIVRVQIAKTPMLVKCGIDGEGYWSDEECSRADKHGLILRQPSTNMGQLI
jgi:hypothetical protein